MRLFDWFIRHLYWTFPTAFLGVWLGIGLLNSLPVEDPVLKRRVVAALASAADRAVGNTLRVDLARLPPFAWDTLYVFSRAGTAEAISQATGLAWRGQGVNSDDNLLVFLWRGRLAGFVEFRGFNEEPTAARLVNFDGHFAMGELFTPATATFQAVRLATKQANGKPGRFIALHRRHQAPIYRPAYARYLTQTERAAQNGKPWPVWPAE